MRMKNPRSTYRGHHGQSASPCVVGDCVVLEGQIAPLVGMSPSPAKSKQEPEGEPAPVPAEIPEHPNVSTAGGGREWFRTIDGSRTRSYILAFLQGLNCEEFFSCSLTHQVCPGHCIFNPLCDILSL